MILTFSEEQRRVTINLAQYYDAWLSASRELRNLGRLAWKTVNEKDYLYSIIDNRGNAKSLGPRSKETEKTFTSYIEAKETASTRLKEARERLRETGRLYIALKLGVIPSEAADVLREADLRGLLGNQLLVVGTTVIPAYEIEAARRFSIGMDMTEDFDLAWSGKSTALAVINAQTPLMSLLKAIDPTYTLNTERTFQARNAKAFEVEFLVAPSVEKTLPPSETLRPVALPEQEWLLKGNPVEHVVCARDGTAAKIVAPDPRWFALHKLWLSEKSSRKRVKAEKDKQQGEALWEVIKQAMPHYRLDAQFKKTLPKELVPIFEKQASRFK